MESSAAQVKIIFTTRHSQFELPEEKRQLIVPADIKRYGLSRILNSESLLDTSSPVPFDFLVDGTLVQGTLEAFLRERGTSLESTVQVEYTPALPPPIYQNSFEHDEWVSSIDILSASSPIAAAAGLVDLDQSRERLLTACYDKSFRIWDHSGKLLAAAPDERHGGHSLRLNVARWVTPRTIASAGLNWSVQLWDYVDAEETGTLKPKLQPKLRLCGHRGQIADVTVHHPSKRLLTASADGHIGLWTTSKSSAPAWDPPARDIKRAKTTSSVTVPERGSLSLIKVSDHHVPSAIFDPRDSTVAYSASWDASICTLDLTTSRVVTRITTADPLTCLTTITPSSSSTPLLAAGSTARHIKLVDPRTSAATTSILSLRGHTNKISSVRAAPPSLSQGGNVMISSSWDSTCRVWDLRSAGTSLYSIGREWLKGKSAPEAGEGAKVLAVEWDRDWGIVSGGEDKKVQINAVEGLFGSS